MAMETDIVRSDNEQFWNEIKRILEQLFKSLLARLSPRAQKAIKTVASKVYRNQIAGKSRVEKDGPTKEVDHLEGVNIEEMFYIRERCLEENAPWYAEGYNHKSDEIGKRKTVAEINKFCEVSTNLKEAQRKLANNPDSVFLQKQYDKCKQVYNLKVKHFQDGFDEEKYNTLVNEKISAYYEKHPMSRQYKLTPEERQECYEKACSGEPFTFRVTFNKSRSAFFDKLGDEIREQRAMRGESVIESTLDPNKSALYEKLQSDYLVYDKDKYAEKYAKAMELRSEKSSLTPEEVLALKKDCLYQTVTYNAFVAEAKQEGKAYTVYQCDEAQADTICKELRSDSNCSKFTCAYSDTPENEPKKVNIYVYDDDEKILNNKINAPIKEHCVPSNSPKSSIGVDVQNYTHRISPEQVEFARSVLKDKSYSMTYKRDKYDRPFVELTVSSISPEEAKQMFTQENIANVVDEKISELHQREFNNTKNDIYSMKENKWTVSNIVKDLRNKAEGSKSCADFINKYDEMITFNNGKDMSESDYNDFVDTYYNHNQDLEKYKLDYQNKMASQAVKTDDFASYDSKKQHPTADIDKNTLPDDVINIDIEIGEE